MTTADRIALDELNSRLLDISVALTCQWIDKPEAEKEEISYVQRTIWVARHLLQKIVDQAKAKQAEQDSLDQCTEQELNRVPCQKSFTCDWCGHAIHGGATDHVAGGKHFHDGCIDQHTRKSSYVPVSALPTGHPG